MYGTTVSGVVRLVRGGISGTLGVIYNPQFLYTPLLPGPLTNLSSSRYIYTIPVRVHLEKNKQLKPAAETAAGKPGNYHQVILSRTSQVVRTIVPAGNSSETGDSDYRTW